jgi:hypothetical protein
MRAVQAVEANRKNSFNIRDAFFGIEGAAGGGRKVHPQGEADSGGYAAQKEDGRGLWRGALWGVAVVEESRGKACARSELRWKR